MSRQMLGQVIRTSKSLSAGVASVRPLTCVDAQVAVHVALATEGASAELALERTFARVFADVQLEIFLGAESFAAKRAQVRTARIVLRRRLNRSTAGRSSAGCGGSGRCGGGTDLPEDVLHETRSDSRLTVALGQRIGDCVADEAKGRGGAAGRRIGSGRVAGSVRVQVVGGKLARLDAGIRQNGRQTFGSDGIPRRRTVVQHVLGRSVAVGIVVQAVKVQVVELFLASCACKK